MTLRMLSKFAFIGYDYRILINIKISRLCLIFPYYINKEKYLQKFEKYPELIHCYI